MRKRRKKPPKNTKEYIQEYRDAQGLLKLSQPAVIKKKAPKRTYQRRSGGARFADAVAEWAGNELVWPSDELRGLMQRESVEPLTATKLLSALRSRGLLLMSGPRAPWERGALEHRGELCVCVCVCACMCGKAFSHIHSFTSSKLGRGTHALDPALRVCAHTQVDHDTTPLCSQ